VLLSLAVGALSESAVVANGWLAFAALLLSGKTRAPLAFGLRLRLRHLSVIPELQIS
jgi:hypothetical protein